MERLTWHNGEQWTQVQNPKVGYRSICTKLAAYEDTGLEPEEVVALKEAEQKRRKGCEFCRIELRHFPYVVAHSDYASSDKIYTPDCCPLCGRDLRGESHE